NEKAINSKNSKNSRDGIIWNYDYPLKSPKDFNDLYMSDYDGLDKDNGIYSTEKDNLEYYKKLLEQSMQDKVFDNWKTMATSNSIGTTIANTNTQSNNNSHSGVTSTTAMASMSSMASVFGNLGAQQSTPTRSFDHAVMLKRMME